jgi:hypothetical protein
LILHLVVTPEFKVIDSNVTVSVVPRPNWTALLTAAVNIIELSDSKCPVINVADMVSQELEFSKQQV